MTAIPLVRAEEPSTAARAAKSRAGEITSLAIVPSRRDGGWILYERGAKAIVKGRNLKRVEIRYYPTGTGIETYTVEGEMKKVQTSRQVETWELALSDDIMSTNFWAEGIDSQGRTVKSIDLSNVGRDDSNP